MDSITDFENAIASAKNEFLEQFKIMLVLVEDETTSSQQVQDCLTKLHQEAVRYFNLFGRSINEYGLDKFKSNENIRNSKIDDCINISETILKYWNMLPRLEEKYQIPIPEPGARAYSSIQIFLKTFEPQKADELKSKFQDANLPISGFNSKKTFIDMTKKQQVKFSVIAGLVLLVGLVIIALVVKCPTNFQDNIFKTVLALAAAAFAAAIPGLINVNYRGIITASGALAVFVIVFIFQPAQINDFASCSDQFISGTTYFGDRPIESVQLRFLKLNLSTTSNNFGSFNQKVDFSRIGDSLKIQILNRDPKIDTLISVSKSELSESLDLYIKAYCTRCTAKNQNDEIVNQRNPCSGDKQYIIDYERGFIRASEQQSLSASCERQ